MTASMVGIDVATKEETGIPYIRTYVVEESCGQLRPLLIGRLTNSELARAVERAAILLRLLKRETARRTGGGS